MAASTPPRRLEASPSVPEVDRASSLLVPPMAESPAADLEALEDPPAIDLQGDLLRDVFESIAPHGTITLDQLPFLLAGAEVPASAAEVQAAIDLLLPDAADALLDFQHVELIHQHLMQTAAAAQLAPTGPKPHPAESLRCWLTQRWRERRQRRRLNQTAYEKHMRPTARLLLVILCTSCSICVAIVVVALVLIWDFSIDNVMSHIKRDVDLMRTGMNLFAWQRPVELNAEDSRQLASLVSVLINELGFKGTKETLKEILEFEGQAIGGLLDGWYEGDARTRVEVGSSIIGNWVDFLVQYENVPTATVVELVNTLNANLPSGHEIELSRLNATSGLPSLLTNPRFGSQCVGGQCGTDPASAIALSGQSGSWFGVDYRPAAVVAGYTFLPNTSLGTVFKVDAAELQRVFRKSAAQLVNAGNLYSLLLHRALNLKTTDIFVLAALTVNTTEIISDVSGCDAACLASTDAANSPAALAARNQSGVVETVDLLGKAVMAAYTPLSRSGLGLSAAVRVWDLFEDLQPSFAGAVTAANANFNGTKEVQVALFANSTVMGQNGANTSQLALTFLGAPKFTADCGDTPCVLNATTCPYMQTSATQCSLGNVESVDYRGTAVFVGYACAAELRAAVAVKVDVSQLKAEGIVLAETICEYQNDVRFKDSTTEFRLAKKKPGVLIPLAGKDLIRITPLKHSQDCPDRICKAISPHVQWAVQGQSGVVIGPDYRGVKVVGAYTYVDALDVAFVINMEYTEASESSVKVSLQLAGCSVAAVAIGMVFLYVWTNRLLRSMDKAWDEGKRAIETEKEAFGAVIRAMYPPPVAKRLLAGETDIVYNMPRVTVFFSDICEFATAANAINAEELMQFMGYTFGVMDAAAEHFRVHKVKTIGDAYLAVAGLPGCNSLTGTICLDMLLFASACVQLFSPRYLHPEGGDILGTVHATLFGRRLSGGGGEEAGTTLPRMPSGIVYGNPAFTNAADPDPAGVPPAQCVMRYGVSNGPVTAGILPGKVPLFDIWGKTVNLASRMESTGQPGRIQVSEGVHHALLKTRDQPFTFHARHKVYCKGFGQVFAYFVATTSVPPPEELLTHLHIEPNLGRFHFETAPAPAGAVSGAAVPHTSRERSFSHSSLGSDDVRVPAISPTR